MRSVNRKGDRTNPCGASVLLTIAVTIAHYCYNSNSAPSVCICCRESRKEEVREEVVYDTLNTLPQHTVRNLPPFTNVSLRLILSNPEGRKESEELMVLTDEDGTTYDMLPSH